MTECDYGCEHVMQTRCVHCGQEQWAFIVWQVSHGERPCRWCGKVAGPMTVPRYLTALEKQT